MKITFDLPNTIDALTNVFYAKENDGRTRIWSWTIAPKDCTEYSVVQNPDGSFGVVESIHDNKDDISENSEPEKAEKENK